MTTDEFIFIMEENKMAKLTTAEFIEAQRVKRIRIK